MSNILIIEKDQKIAEQIESLIDEMNRHKKDLYSNLQEFEEAYFSKSSSRKPLGTVDVLIVKLDVFTEEATPFIDQLIQKLTVAGYCPDQPPRIVIVKYDDDGIHKNTLMHPSVIDIIYLPIDRLLFLQKLQIITELPERATPEYLFTEKVDYTIEISKKSPVERMTRCGFTIFNPTAMSVGSLANVYLKLDPSNPLKVPCRVAQCEPKSEVSNLGYYVHFNYYAMSRKTSSELGIYFARIAPNFQDFINGRKEVFKPPEDQPPHERVVRNVLILDHEPSCSSIRNELLESFYSIEASYESEYKDFHTKYFAPTATKTASMGNLDDLSTGSLIFNVNPSTEELIRVTTKFSEDDRIVGYKIRDFFENPTEWKDLFNTEGAKELLEYGLQFCLPNEITKKLGDLDSQDNEEKLMVFEFMRIADDDVRIEIKPPLQQYGPSDHEKSIADKNPKLSKIDLVIAHRDFISENVDIWIKQFQAKCEEKKLCRKDSQVKFIIIDPMQTILEKQIPFNSNIVSILHSAGARKVLFSLVAQSLTLRHTLFAAHNLNFAEAEFDAHIGRPILLNSISEYGASVTSRINIPVGSVFFLHGPLFDKSQERMVAAKFYFSKEMELEKDKKVFVCHFIYFGVTDDFLKYARSWIRENYAQQKSAQLESKVEVKK